MQLFRTVAYRMESARTPLSQRWPEVTVFLQAASHGQATHKLPELLAAVWVCDEADIDQYNLCSEAELVDRSNYGEVRSLGEAALLVNGWHHGPLFCDPDRTLALVDPPTLTRLYVARCLAQPLAVQQRKQAEAADQAEQARRLDRLQRQRELVDATNVLGNRYL